MVNKVNKEMSYRELKEGLDEAILNLQQDDIGIDDAINLYQKAQELIKQLEAYMKTAENKITKIKTQFDS
jgi:exodeoxyribonuclease VII small subunit